MELHSSAGWTVAGGPISKMVYSKSSWHKASVHFHMGFFYDMVGGFTKGNERGEVMISFKPNTGSNIHHFCHILSNIAEKT